MDLPTMINTMYGTRSYARDYKKMHNTLYGIYCATLLMRQSVRTQTMHDMVDLGYDGDYRESDINFFLTAFVVAAEQGVNLACI